MSLGTFVPAAKKTRSAVTFQADAKSRWIWVWTAAAIARTAASSASGTLAFVKTATLRFAMATSRSSGPGAAYTVGRGAVSTLFVHLGHNTRHVALRADPRPGRR